MLIGGVRRPLAGVITMDQLMVDCGTDPVERGDEVVLIGGRRRPLAGTITMDQLMVDCGSDQVAVGDEVVLLGRQGDEQITADEWAALLDTIAYEIVCGISPRVPRRYS